MVIDYWEMKRLVVRNATEADIDAMLALFNANAHVAAWDPTFKPTTRESIAELVDKSLRWEELGQRPFQMQCCVERASGRMAGYYHCTYGLPHPDVVWISMFVFAPEYQRGGFAREVIDGLAPLWWMLPEQRRTWAEVYVKNWPALRFWINAGFKTVIEWEGPVAPTADAFPSIIFEKRWKGRAQ
jgi:ribosomal protein S18 acetylase RimI-like enzyme